MQKYYKAFNRDLTCRGMQYEIGKEYTFDGEPIPCQQGFHFCKSITDVYNFYDMSEDTRVCEVKPLGDIVTNDEIKYCTNKIKIVKEVKNPRVKSNTSESNSGYCNSGYCNSGNRNSGNRNSGDWNSGNRNSGDWNSGDWNSGDWNSGNRNSGVFNTEKNPKIKLFDKESDWTFANWYNSNAYGVMAYCPYTHSYFINEFNMTDEEKAIHPEYKTIGGYVKTFIATKENKQNWWNNLSSEDRQSVYDLPNFDAYKFEMCTGIKVSENGE